MFSQTVIAIHVIERFISSLDKNMSDEIKKSIATEITGAAVDMVFPSLTVAAGFPVGVFATPLVKGFVLGLVQNCFNDYAQRTLSISEMRKLTQEYTVALRTFRELAEHDGIIAWEMNLDDTCYDYFFEVAEHVTMEGIRQSENTKVDILGRYYGRQFYNKCTDWQNMHQIINMVGTLTLRQLVVIRLIVEGFEGENKSLFISNPSACVEINRLKDYGIWKTTGAAFGINESGAIQLSELMPTEYAKQVNESLMLSQLSNSDILRTKESLNLTIDGEPKEVLTKKDYEDQLPRFRTMDGVLSINGGNAI